MDKIERKVNILVSLPKQTEEDLRDLARIIYPNTKRGAVSLTAEDAIRHLAKQEKYEKLLKEFRNLRIQISELKEEVKASEQK